MNRYKIRYYSPEGHEWVLMGDEWLAGIKSGGIDGLVGDGDDVTIARVGDVGQSLDSFQPKPMTGTLTVFVRGDDAADVDAVWAEFRSGFSRTRAGTLVVESPSQVLSAGVRLSGPIPAPDEDPTSGALVRDVQVPLVADRCGWWTDWLSETGTVTVTNWGDLTSMAKNQVERVPGNRNPPLRGETLPTEGCGGANRIVVHGPGRIRH